MRSLTEWESYLRPYFQRRLRLIGEIPLRRRDVEDMADSLSSLIQRSKNLARATDTILQYYPCVFLAFLTGFAAHNIERDYWGQIATRLNTERGYLFNQHWHHHYIELVKGHNLRYFTGDEASNRYVTTIRFHGGIPAYSLPDFFARIVIPSVQRPAYAELSSRKALDLLLKNIYNVDLPVIHFLTNSGDLGVEFFQSCRDMAIRFFKEQELPAPETTDLPIYVIEAFATYMEIGQEQGLRLRKPILFFDPYPNCESHLHLRLPEEQIPLRYVEDQIIWQVTWQGQRAPLEIRPSIHKQRQDVLTRESFHIINAAPESLRVSLLRQGGSGLEPVRRWNLACLPPKDRPLLAFREISHGSEYPGQMFNLGFELPATTLLLVFPADVTLQANGSAHCIENTNLNLSGAWQGWQAQRWDLQNTFAVHLLRNGEEICPPIPIEAAGLDPELGGTVFVHNDDPNGIPLYAGHTPVLKIPLRPGQPLVDELSRWKVELRPHWETSPPVNKETDLSTYIEQVILDEENIAEFDLKALLGEQAAGTFTLCVRCISENEFEFCFRMWPSFYLLDLQKYYFPTGTGEQQVEFNLRLPDDTFCEVQPGANGISVEAGAIASKVIVQADVIRADLYLVKPLAAGESVRVPLYIPIARMQWSLLIGTTEEEIEWSPHPVQRPIDAVLQATSASVHLRMHGLQNIAERVNLLLIDPDHPDEIIQEERIRTNPLGKDWLRIPLGPFRTTLSRYEQASQLELHISYRAPRNEESVRVPIVLLSRRLDIRNVNLQPAGELTWRLTWDESHSLRNRRVLIGSAWQPWWEPWEFQIPDNARGEFMIENVGLLPSKYRIHFYTAHIGEPRRTTYPESDVVEISTCTPETRIAQLTGQTSRAAGEEFRDQFELVCIYNELGKSYDTVVSSCIENVKTGQLTNVHLLLGFYKWLKEQETQRYNAVAVSYWILKPIYVRYVLEHLPHNDPLRREFMLLVLKAKYLDSESSFLLAQKEDDPFVVNHCLKHLIQQHYEQRVVELIINMVQNARLSNRDAADLLALKCEPAIQDLLKNPETPTRDSLIVSLFHYGNGHASVINSLSSELLAGMVACESNPEFSIIYIRALIERQESAGVRALIQSYRDGQMDDAEAKALLSLNPSFTLPVLQSISHTEHDIRNLADHLIQLI